jgi:lipopolysaccharide heptosyltransferase II
MFKFGYKLIKLNKEIIKRILIIKLRGIGDVVHSTIVIDNLKEDFPNAQIDYLVDAPSQPGLDGLKYINQIIIFDRKSFWKRLLLILKIRRIKYDVIFDFYSNPSTALITFLSGAKFRVGYPYRGRKYAYNLFGPADRGKFHSAQLHLETLKSIGLTSSHESLYYNINDKAINFANEFFEKTFSQNDFVIGICPTGGWESKKCDPEKFAEIASGIIQKYKARILILWGKSDENDATMIHSLLGGKSVLAPVTSIQELAALISKCKLLIANDSGPMHISTAVKTPVLGLFGPTNPNNHGPFGEKNDWIQLTELDCIICNLLICPRNHECFRSLSIDIILNKIDNLILINNI